MSPGGPFVITSTMQDDVPLTTNAITRHTAALHGDVELAAFDGERVHRTPYAVVLDRALRLAGEMCIRDKPGRAGRRRGRRGGGV